MGGGDGVAGMWGRWGCEQHSVGGGGTGGGRYSGGGGGVWWGFLLKFISRCYGNNMMVKTLNSDFRKRLDNAVDLHATVPYLMGWSLLSRM